MENEMEKNPDHLSHEFLFWLLLLNITEKKLASIYKRKYTE